MYCPSCLGAECCWDCKFEKPWWKWRQGIKFQCKRQAGFPEITQVCIIWKFCVYLQCKWNCSHCMIAEEILCFMAYLDSFLSSSKNSLNEAVRQAKEQSMAEISAAFGSDFLATGLIQGLDCIRSMPSFKKVIFCEIFSLSSLASFWNTCKCFVQVYWFFLSTVLSSITFLRKCAGLTHCAGDDKSAMCKAAAKMLPRCAWSLSVSLTLSPFSQ